MNIIGNLIGRTFPKSTIANEICNHRHGALATITQDTDTIQATSRYAAELLGFKYNIGLSAFINPYSDNDTDKLNCEASGRIRFDIYFPTDRWKNPITNVIELIPDYLSATWTAAGVAVFSTAVLGEAKSTYYPNHGAEMYTASAGAYGYSTALDTAGASNLSELYGVADYIISYYQTLLGRRISAISYRNGTTGAFTGLITKFLAGRQSGYTTTGDSNTEYGRSRIAPYAYLGLPARAVARFYQSSRTSSTRWWDNWHFYGLTEAQSDTYCKAEIAKTIANGGWYNDFIHWHNAYEGSDLNALNRWFNSINTEIGENFVHRCGYGEAVEYLFFREAIRRVSTFEQSNKVYILIDVFDKFKGTDTDGVDNDLILSAINVPISIKVDLTGTALAGKDIKTNATGIKSLGSNQYIIDISFSNKVEGYIQAIIEEETGTPDYYDFDLPAIVSATVVSEVLTIVTDKPTNVVIFTATRGAAIETATLLSRSNTLSTYHTIALTLANQAKDVYIGVITREKQSILSTVYQFI